jgi:hypothetical protein
MPKAGEISLADIPLANGAPDKTSPYETLLPSDYFAVDGLFGRRATRIG